MALPPLHLKNHQPGSWRLVVDRVAIFKAALVNDDDQDIAGMHDPSRSPALSIYLVYLFYRIDPGSNRYLPIKGKEGFFESYYLFTGFCVDVVEGDFAFISANTMAPRSPIKSTIIYHKFQPSRFRKIHQAKLNMNKSEVE